MKKLAIAIDGPAGAGKSTAAKLIAERLEYTYIDTGAMYRAAVWNALNLGIDINDTPKLIEATDKMELKIAFLNGKTRVWVDGVEVSEDIRMPEVSNLVALVAKVPEVRQIMLKAQQKMAQGGGVVMDGRDTTTHVMPNAEVKVFLTAGIKERAKRRYLEFVNKGINVDLEDLEKEIEKRDKEDLEREAAPLVRAEDAVLIDTTDLSIADAVEEILKLCQKVE